MSGGVEVPTWADHVELATFAGADRAALDALAGQVQALAARVAVLEARPPAPVPGPGPEPAPGPPGRVTQAGTWLKRDGARYQFTGLNWEYAIGCGLPGANPDRVQAERYFAELAPGSMTRVWAMPGIHPELLTRYDMIVTAAAKYGQYLCVTLLNGQPNCTSRQEKSYPRVIPGDVAEHVRSVLRRSAGNPAVAMVEPANEADENHPNIGAWYQAMGALIHSVDRDVLVCTGGGHNSSDPGKIAAFAAGPDINVISYHGYCGAPGTREGRTNAFVEASRRVGKPWVAGERGYCCCDNNLGSADLHGRKLAEEWRLYLATEGCAGHMYWDFRLNQPHPATAAPGNGLWRAACDFRVPV